MPDKHRSNEGNRQGVRLGALLVTLNIMWLATTLQIILVYTSPHVRASSWLSGSAIIYSPEDFFFDILTPLTLNMFNPLNNESFVNVGVGVLITKDRILTSYNPFRTLLHNKTLWDKLLVSTTTGRTRYKNGTYDFMAYRHKVSCGRQVQFLPDENIEDHLWLGTDRRNSPLHDLAVFRIHADIPLGQVPPADYAPKHFPIGKDTSKTPGIYRAQIATPIDFLGAYFKFGTLALTGKQSIINYNMVKTVEYEPDDHALVSCDDWFPREWGYFICILNKENHPVLGSGAMLVSDHKVFGVGSFALFRGEQSIMVFTDVRPYYEHISKACTYDDSEEKVPDSFPKNQW